MGVPLVGVNGGRARGLILIVVDPFSSREAVFTRVPGLAFSIRSSVSSRSASRGGLSQRSRLMRGNRIATPDLCRGERSQALESDFQHQPLIRFMHDMPHGPEFLGGVAADEAVDCSSSSSVKPQ